LQSARTKRVRPTEYINFQYSLCALYPPTCHCRFCPISSPVPLQSKKRIIPSLPAHFSPRTQEAYVPPHFSPRTKKHLRDPRLALRWGWAWPQLKKKKNQKASLSSSSSFLPQVIKSHQPPLSRARVPRDETTGKVGRRRLPFSL
jgi:hypothetical protein